MHVTRAEAMATLRRVGWLAGEPKRMQDAILSRAILREYRADEYVYHADGEPGGIFGVVSGGLGVLIPSASGTMMLCHIARRGIWFGEGPANTGRRRALAVRSVEPSVVFHLPLQGIRALRADLPDFARLLAGLAVRNYAELTFRVIGDLMISPGERRIAATLVRISRPEPGDEDMPPWPIHLSQEDIGQMANASRDRVNRALAKFTRAGWISVDFRTVLVTDLARLEAFAWGEA